MHMKVNNVMHSWIHIVNSYKKCQLSSLRLEGATRASTDASSVESRLDWSKLAIANLNSELHKLSPIFSRQLQHGGLLTTWFVDCHLMVEYVMNSLEVKWNGWWGTGFLEMRKSIKMKNLIVQIWFSPCNIAKQAVTYCLALYSD